MIDPEILKEIKLNTDRVVSSYREQFGKELTLDKSGIEWVNGYIDRVRDSFPPEKRRSLVACLASFLGECIIKTHGGVWTECDGQLCVCVTNRFSACPFSKVEKQFQNGSEDSIASFFNLIPVLAKQIEKD